MLSYLCRYILSTVVAKSFENDTNINFHKVCCLSLYDDNLHILQDVMKSDQMKVPLCYPFQPCHKRTSSHHVSDSLSVIQLRDRGTTSTELAQEWQQTGVCASARTVRRRLLESGVKKGSKEATSLQENHQGQTDILQKLIGLDC